MKREELIRNREYWIVQIQNSVYNLIENFLKERKFNKTQLADHLGVTKGYVSQMLSGEYNHKISKLVDLSLSFNKAPIVTFVDIDQYIQDDKDGKVSIEHPLNSTIECFVISSDSKSVLRLDSKFSEILMANWYKNSSHSSVSTSVYLDENAYSINYSQYNKLAQSTENGK